MPAERGGAYLAACTIYRDDAAYLAEWIEFHRLMGVERFFLYDNGSTDDHEQVLAPYVAEGIVVVHQWPHAFLGHNGRPRAIFTAFEDCCGRHAQDARWIAFLDVDEFLFSPTGASLPEVLQEYERVPRRGGQPGGFRPLRACDETGRAGDRELSPAPGAATR